MRTTPKMGLFSWDQLGDNYNYAQLAQNFQTLDYHDHTGGRGTQVPAGGLAPGAVLSSNIAANQIGLQHFALSTIQNLGLNQPGQVSQGYVSIGASQSISTSSFSYLGTPDQIANVTINNGGLIFIAYQAMWQSSVSAAGTAAIFIGANQLTAASLAGGAPAVQQAVTTGTTALSLATASNGLVSGTSGTYSGDVTTGQIVGVGATAGIVTAFAAAGTYTVGVQFKASSGNIAASNRKLWVWTRNFN